MDMHERRYAHNSNPNPTSQMPKLHIVVGVLFACLVLLDNAEPLNAQHPQIVPAPKSIVSTKDAVGITLGDKITTNIPADKPLIREHMRAFEKALVLGVGSALEIKTGSTDAILQIKLDENLFLEEYQISIRDQRIRVKASSIKGISHATATLLQLIAQSERKTIAAMEIRDKPDCPYRSFMIDVGRNAHGLGCLKETVDLLWFYKVDSFHLHLTDDQRFAFPSKAFPKLATERGKITWKEFESLEKYARARGVTLIPELDVPGHSTILRRVYPEVFGKTTADLAKQTESRAAIKTLLDEMIELFPSSPYIHIGGDEAGGVSEEVQRDFINELHAHLKSNGKKTVVWEGPRLGEGENKVNPEVIHINWRTINFPADKMLEAGYPVVNAAWDPLYLVDHYPRNNFTMASPEYIYRNLDQFRFAHFNPGIPTFAKPVIVEPNDAVIGFCMPWWEGREENYFPLIVPRLIPMADVGWNAKQKKDFSSFDQRSISSEAIRLNAFYPVTIAASPMALEREGVFHKQTTIQLTSSLEGDIHFTLDGSEPTVESSRYTESFSLSKTTNVRAALFFAGGKQVDHGTRKTFVHVDPVKNLALGKSVTTNVTSGPIRSPARLTDGGTGTLDYFLGYPAEPEPILVTIDLGSDTPINRIVTHSFTNGSAFESYEVLVSKDGQDFTKVADRTKKPEKATSTAVHHFEKSDVRYIRISTNGCKGYVFDSFSKLIEIQAFLIE